MSDIHGKVTNTIDNFRGFEGTHGIDRAKALAEWGMLDDALHVLNACLVLQPSMDNALYNRGTVLTYLSRYEEAIADFNAVIDYRNAHKKPSNYRDPAIYSRGFCNLALGNLDIGFHDYEPRRRHLMALPMGEQYTGEQDLKGKTLFIVGEPSFSNSLLFSRYLPKVHADICLAVPLDQQVLFRHFPGIRLAMQTLGHYDYWCTLMGLADIFRTTTETIPLLPKFLLPLEGTIYWKPDRGPTPKRFIGLAWSGPECMDNGSIPLDLLSPLFEYPRLEFFSLQDEVKNEDKAAFDRLDIFNMGQKFKSYLDAACSIKSMDLVITVDNAIAHLAATLNVPCFLLLPKYRSNWLWASNKNVSPWYPSVRIFRQFKDGDWTSVVAEVQKALIDFCQL